MEENLSDIAGVRVICSFPEDVYMVADALLSQDDVTLIRKKDYIAEPKPNGYRSLHLIVTAVSYTHLWEPLLPEPNTGESLRND